MTTESDNPPGYELVRRIGSGATSVVWEAAQLSTGRRVALKMLDIDVTDPAALRRFERERKVMSSLATHPGIVTIYDAGVHRHKPVTLTPTPTASPTPSRRPSATVTPSASQRLDTAGRALAARITGGHVDVASCRPWSYAPGPGLVAAITCNSGELSNRVGFLQFDTDADMARFITTTKNTIAADRFGRCDKGLGQSNPWTYRGQTKGDLACVRTGTPLVTKVWWSSFGTGVVASAQDTDAAKAWSWFIANSLIVA